MFNVTFYEDEISADSIPQKTGECDLSTLKDGSCLFYENSNIEFFIKDLSSLMVGKYMFFNCQNLKEFNCPLSLLENGTEMFSNCINLYSIGRYVDNFNLNSLKEASSMFYNCKKLVSIGTDFPNLINGDYMFNGTNVQKINMKFPVLKSGYLMFSQCPSLISFNADLSSLTEGTAMFKDSKNLTTFIGDLGSLMRGNNMFSECKLDANSVMMIAESLRDNSSSSSPSSITIGINVSASETDGKDTATQLLEFAKEAGYENWEHLKQRFVDKKWNVAFQFEGTSTNITLGEDGTSNLPIYAKLIEVIPEGVTYSEKDKRKAEYCTEDGTKFYNIDWGHDVNNHEDYQLFGSLLEACGYFGIIPKSMITEI